MSSLLSSRARRALLALALVAVALMAGYFLWLRDSELLRVEQTTITGLTTSGAREIRDRLAESASGMTTLNVDEEELERAVASYPAVAAVEATADLPHGLAIEVIERRPIATVEGPSGDDLPVAADGTLLPDFDPRGPLARLPATAPSATGRLDGDDALTALAAVDAAPAPLREQIESVDKDEAGRLAATLRNGPLVLLGGGSDLEAKWAAAAAAIGEGGAASAGYVDVSLPERPAAGAQATRP